MNALFSNNYILILIINKFKEILRCTSCYNLKKKITDKFEKVKHFFGTREGGWGAIF